MESDVHERTDGKRAGRRSFHVMQTQRDAMMLKQREHLVCIPRGLPEFDGVTASPRQRLQKRFETGEAHRRQWPARRQLIKDRPERRAEQFCARKEELERTLGILELLHVRQIPARFQGVYEPARHAPAPGSESRGVGQPIEGVIDLNGIEALGVVLQPPALRQVGRIEVATPMFVLPSGASDAYGWGKFFRHLRLQSLGSRVESLHVSASPAEIPITDQRETPPAR